ncbi:MAG TPA: hypothetical protein VLK65_22350 [Vicinamibacteria bacterium]|nr:hypothetical protein [Vicinamibacteria bacterium]
MNESLQVELERGLTAAMKRFHGSFLGDGVRFGENKVQFRGRPDFGTPLVTVLGHTYGLRLVPGPFVEASVNVYDDEFELNRFKDDLRGIYAWSHVSRIIANFAGPEDERILGGDTKQLASLFRLDAGSDVEVVEKRKAVASIVSGRLVDRVLLVRYGLDENQLGDSSKNGLFVSGAYLYCLRPFAAAYRKSLATSPSGA